MKIHNIFFGDNGIKQVTGKKNPGVPGSEKVRAKDPTGTAGPDSRTERPEFTASLETDFNPRVEKVRVAGERVSRGEYDGALREAVAGKVIDSPALKELAAEVAVDAEGGEEAADVRDEKLADVRGRVSNGFYDTIEVQKVVAERLLSSLGFTDLMNGPA